MFLVTVYPFVATVRLLSSKSLKNDLLHWCTWWVVFYVLSVAFNFVYWIPLINYVFNVILIALYSSISTEYARANVIVPFVRRFYKSCNWYAYSNQIMYCLQKMKYIYFWYY